MLQIRLSNGIIQLMNHMHLFDLQPIPTRRRSHAYRVRSTWQWQDRLLLARHIQLSFVLQLTVRDFCVTCKELLNYLFVPRALLSERQLAE
jgi:hypothetical protein